MHSNDDSTGILVVYIKKVELLVKTANNMNIVLRNLKQSIVYQTMITLVKIGKQCHESNSNNRSYKI